MLSEPAAMAFALASRSDQHRLAAIFDGVKAAPFRRGDFQERDAQGRINEVLVIGNWLVTYWSDHAVRELRVVRVERVDD